MTGDLNDKDLIDADSVLAESSMERRKFLRVAALTGVTAFFGGAGEAAAALFGPSVTDIHRSLNIPAEWRQKMGPILTEYAAYLNRFKMRHVHVAQVLAPHLKTHGSVHNSIPPKQLWPNIRQTLLVLDRMCSLLREPVGEIVSAYRSPAYNRSCPGARRNSQHMHNRALDLKFRSSPSRVALAARELRKRGLYKGGIGTYYAFTHIDTRGENVDW